MFYLFCTDSLFRFCHWFICQFSSIAKDVLSYVCFLVSLNQRQNLYRRPVCNFVGFKTHERKKHGNRCHESQVRQKKPKSGLFLASLVDKLLQDWKQGRKGQIKKDAGKTGEEILLDLHDVIPQSSSDKYSKVN